MEFEIERNFWKELRDAIILILLLGGVASLLSYCAWLTENRLNASWILGVPAGIVAVLFVEVVWFRFFSLLGDWIGILKERRKARRKLEKEFKKMFRVGPKTPDVQVKVDGYLEHLAFLFFKAAYAQDEFQGLRIENLSFEVTVYLGSLVKFDVEDRKAEFWRVHNLVRDIGLLVRERYTDYLPEDWVD